MAGATTASMPAPASRLWVGLAALFSTAFTSTAGYFSAVWVFDHQTVKNEQVSELSRFVKTTEAFEPAVRAHMRAMLDHKDLRSTKEKLLSNIQEQHIQLESVRPFIPLDLRSEADKYQLVLERAGSSLEGANSPLTAGPLMQSASDWVTAKRRLVAALRKGAGLPSS